MLSEFDGRTDNDTILISVAMTCNNKVFITSYLQHLIAGEHDTTSYFLASSTVHDEDL